MSLSEVILAIVAIGLGVCLYLEHRQRVLRVEDKSQCASGLDVGRVMPCVKRLREDPSVVCRHPPRNDSRRKEWFLRVSRRMRGLSFFSRNGESRGEVPPKGSP